MSNEYLDIAMRKVITQEVNKALEDIKLEISELQDNPYITDDEYELVRGILKIIDKHIGEQT